MLINKKRTQYLWFRRVFEGKPSKISTLLKLCSNEDFKNKIVNFEFLKKPQKCISWSPAIASRLSIISYSLSHDPCNCWGSNKQVRSIRIPWRNHFDANVDHEERSNSALAEADIADAAILVRTSTGVVQWNIDKVVDRIVLSLVLAIRRRVTVRFRRHLSQT